MKKFYKNSLALAVILLAFSATAQDRDPFSPSNGTGVITKMKELVTGNENPQPTNFDGTNPLTSGQLNSYRIIGVMISESKKIASVKAMNGVSYIVSVGDALGSEGGKISEISFDGIKVQTNEKEIKLPVNNKIEVPANAAKTQ